MKSPCVNALRLGAACSALVAAALAAPAHAAIYTADLGSLNNSGVTGTATLELNGNLLTVTTHVEGLEEGRVHAQHIHGRVGPGGVPLPDFLPTLALDSDGDGLLEVAEGVPAYGPVIIGLTLEAGGFPFVPSDGDANLFEGVIDYTRTFDITDPTIYDPIPGGGGALFTAAQLLPLDFREVVVHGLCLGTVEQGSDRDCPNGTLLGANGGEANGTVGYKGPLPVASGLIAFAVPAPGTALLVGLGLLGMIPSLRRFPKA